MEDFPALLLVYCFVASSFFFLFCADAMLLIVVPAMQRSADRTCNVHLGELSVCATYITLINYEPIKDKQFVSFQTIFLTTLRLCIP